MSIDLDSVIENTENTHSEIWDLLPEKPKSFAWLQNVSFRHKVKKWWLNSERIKCKVAYSYQSLCEYDPGDLIKTEDTSANMFALYQIGATALYKWIPVEQFSEDFNWTLTDSSEKLISEIERLHLIASDNYKKDITLYIPKISKLLNYLLNHGIINTKEFNIILGIIS